MTINEIKEKLPDVPYATGRNRPVYRGKICGRKNAFATLCSQDGLSTWEVSWNVLANVLSDPARYVIVN